MEPLFIGRPELANWAKVLEIEQRYDETDDELRARLTQRIRNTSRAAVLRAHADRFSAQANACDIAGLFELAKKRRRGERLLRHWREVLRRTI